MLPVIMSDDNDRALVTQCLRGDTRAFGQLIDQFQRPLFNAALRIVNDYDEARDVMQAVFVKAYEKLDSFDPKYRFFSWIYRMTVNEAINVVNQRKATVDLDDRLESNQPAPDEAMARAELDRGVEDAVAELKLDYRVAVVLRHFINLSLKDISFILDIPEKTVKSRLFSARQQLSGLLAKRGLGTSG
jgi:RNA polymerase sigma-70 factor (ECF subfamily)